MNKLSDEERVFIAAMAFVVEADIHIEKRKLIERMNAKLVTDWIVDSALILFGAATFHFVYSLLN